MKRKTLILHKSDICPFCAEAKRSIEALRQNYNFELKEVDVSWRPEILIKKGIKEVPTMEVGGKKIVGVPTVRQLLALLGVGDEITEPVLLDAK